MARGRGKTDRAEPEDDAVPLRRHQSVCFSPGHPLASHADSPEVMARRRIIARTNPWGGGGTAPLQCLPGGVRSAVGTLTSPGEVRIYATASETRQEALKIKQERSQLASTLRFIDRKMLNDRWSL